MMQVNFKPYDPSMVDMNVMGMYNPLRSYDSQSLSCGNFMQYTKPSEAKKPAIVLEDVREPIEATKPLEGGRLLSKRAGKGLREAAAKKLLPGDKLKMDILRRISRTR